MSFSQTLVNAMDNANKHRLLQELSRMSAAQLEDYGYSPALLEQGVQGWPWREQSQTVEVLANETVVAVEQTQPTEPTVSKEPLLTSLGLSRKLMPTSFSLLWSPLYR